MSGKVLKNKACFFLKKGKIKLYLSDVGAEWLENGGRFVRRVCEEIYGRDQIAEVTAFERTRHILVVLRTEEYTHDLSERLARRGVVFSDGSVLRVHEPQLL